MGILYRAQTLVCIRRASTIAHIYPSVLQALAGRSYVGPLGRVILGCGGVAMQDPACELRRIPIPRCEYPGGWLWATPRGGLTLIPREAKVCLASDSSAGSPGVAHGHPEPEQRRDLIGARFCVTHHSIVRPLLLIGWKLMATAKGAADVTMIGAERSDTEVETILGVDTHLDFHVAVAIDHLGRRLGEASVPTTVKGHERLLRWAERFGPVRCVGVEGTSSYGAGLARHLGAKGIDVLEVERPERRRRGSRRNLKKSDPSDAEAAARAAVLAGESSGVPKSG